MAAFKLAIPFRIVLAEAGVFLGGYLNEFRNKLIAAGRYTDCVDELLVKTVNAKIEKIR